MQLPLFKIYGFEVEFHGTDVLGIPPGKGISKFRILIYTDDKDEAVRCAKERYQVEKYSRVFVKSIPPDPFAW